MLLELNKRRSAVSSDWRREYDEEFHDELAPVIDICEWLGDTGAFEFRISGFGDVAWPVDVTTDLAVVLGQLPAALSACAMQQSFELNLFEQGVERYLTFEPQDDHYVVICRSGTAWEPCPATEVVSMKATLETLRNLGQTFCRHAEVLVPGITRHQLFQRYVQSLATTNRDDLADS